MITIKSKVLQFFWNLSAVAIAAQLLVAPIAVFYFHKLPLYFIISGIIAIPAAFTILFLGILLLLTDLILGSAFMLTTLISKILCFIIYLFNELIFIIQDLPFCSASDLWLSPSSVILIYLSLFCLGLHFKTKNIKFLFVGLVVLIAQISLHLYEDYNIRSENKLIVYDSYGNSLVQFIKNGHIAEFCTIDASTKTKSYLTTNNNLYNRKIKEVSTKEIGIQTDASFNIVDDIFFVYEPLESILYKKWSRPLDLLILNKNSFLDIEKLAAQGPINQIIIDGSIDKFKAKDIEKSAKELSIPTHYTSKKGAYERTW